MALKTSGRNTSSTTAVWAALIGDVLITVTKIAAAVFTGSAAMTSEAIHTFVDTGNEVLLLYGLRQSKRGPDENHPLGYGRELYFWSFVVALLIGAPGAGASFYEGFVHVQHPEPIRSPGVSYLVLSLSFLFEGASCLVAIRQFNAARGKLGLFEAFRLSKDPPSLLMLFGNAAALVGVVVAAVGTFAASALDRPQLDGVASVLIGEQAYPMVRHSILEIVNADPAILTANGIITVQLAPSQVTVMLSVEFADTMRAPQIEDAVIKLEAEVRKRHPEVVALFVKPQTEETFRKARRARTGKTPPKRECAFPAARSTPPPSK